MGGFGSGQRDGMACTDERRRLDLRQLHRDGYLRPGRSFTLKWSDLGRAGARVHVRVEPDRMLLVYETNRGDNDTGGWSARQYEVPVEWTPCTFGGHRPWWRCPAVGCGRRVAVLHGSHVIACRACHRLAYRSQRESLVDRSTRRADKLRTRLGWEPGVLNESGGKPKGMHWQTYRRLQSRHDALVSRAVTALMADS